MADEVGTASSLILMRVVGFSSEELIKKSNYYPHQVGAGNGAASARNGHGWSKTAEGNSGKKLKEYEYKTSQPNEDHNNPF